jgi:hypothetical protein
MKEGGREGGIERRDGGRQGGRGRRKRVGREGGEGREGEEGEKEKVGERREGIRPSSNPLSPKYRLIAHTLSTSKAMVLM